MRVLPEQACEWCVKQFRPRTPKPKRRFCSQSCFGFWISQHLRKNTDCTPRPKQEPNPVDASVAELLAKPVFLSVRQRQLYRHLVFSYDPLKEIAWNMGLTEGTVKLYAVRIYKKLGVQSRMELMVREINRKRTEDNGPATRED